MDNIPTRDELLDYITKYARVELDDPELIMYRKNTLADYGADGIDIQEIMMAIEEEFGVSFDSFAEKLWFSGTVDSITTLISELMSSPYKHRKENVMIKQVTLAEACANGEFTLILAHNDGTLTSEDVIWNEDLMEAVVVDSQGEDVISAYTYSHLEWVEEQGRNRVKFLINETVHIDCDFMPNDIHEHIMSHTEDFPLKDDDTLKTDLNDPIMGREKFAEMLVDVMQYNVRECRSRILY